MFNIFQVDRRKVASTQRNTFVLSLFLLPSLSASHRDTNNNQTTFIQTKSGHTKSDKNIHENALDKPHSITIYIQKQRLANEKLNIYLVHLVPLFLYPFRMCV